MGPLCGDELDRYGSGYDNINTPLTLRKSKHVNKFWLLGENYH